MPWNLLVLPFIGGYLLVHGIPSLRYYCRRTDARRLTFLAASFGLLLLIVAVVAQESWRIFSPDSYSYFATTWRGVPSVHFRYAAPSIAAMCFGVGIAAAGQLLDKNKAVIKAITRKADPFESLLLRSIHENKTIAITMSSGKVYVGYVFVQPDPGKTQEHISLIPRISGYREPVSKRITFTTDYIPAQSGRLHEAFARNFSPQSKQMQTAAFVRQAMMDFELVVPTCEIQAVTIFDQDIYDRHFVETSESTVSSN